jgi:hypothetical protein
LVPVTDGSRGITTTSPVARSRAPVLRSRRIGEPAMAGVCGGRPVPRQARLRARVRGGVSARRGGRIVEEPAIGRVSGGFRCEASAFLARVLGGKGRPRPPDPC